MRGFEQERGGTDQPSVSRCLTSPAGNPLILPIQPTCLGAPMQYPARLSENWPRFAWSMRGPWAYWCLDTGPAGSTMRRYRA